MAPADLCVAPPVTEEAKDWAISVEDGKEAERARGLRVTRHYHRMVQTRYYDQTSFDETVCTAIIANSGVKTPSKKVQNVCDDGCIKHGSDFNCVCDAGHTVQLN